MSGLREHPVFRCYRSFSDTLPVLVRPLIKLLFADVGLIELSPFANRLRQKSIKAEKPASDGTGSLATVKRFRGKLEFCDTSDSFFVLNGGASIIPVVENAGRGLWHLAKDNVLPASNAVCEMLFPPPPPFPRRHFRVFGNDSPSQVWRSSRSWSVVTRTSP